MSTESKAMTITEAEKKIAGTLAQLEIDQGVLVKELMLESVDVTTGTDDRRQFQQKVAIEVERTPGNNWLT